MAAARRGACSYRNASIVLEWHLLDKSSVSLGLCYGLFEVQAVLQVSGSQPMWTLYKSADVQDSSGGRSTATSTASRRNSSGMRFDAAKATQRYDVRPPQVESAPRVCPLVEMPFFGANNVALGSSLALALCCSGWLQRFAMDMPHARLQPLPKVPMPTLATTSSSGLSLVTNDADIDAILAADSSLERAHLPSNRNSVQRTEAESYDVETSGRIESQARRTGRASAESWAVQAKKQRKAARPPDETLRVGGGIKIPAGGAPAGSRLGAMVGDSEYYEQQARRDQQAQDQRRSSDRGGEDGLDARRNGAAGKPRQ